MDEARSDYQQERERTGEPRRLPPIVTRVVSKWRLLDLETGQRWKYDDATDCWTADEPAEVTVYACEGCGAWHRQLFLLPHADECPGGDWYVTTKPAAQSGRSVEP